MKLNKFMSVFVLIVILAIGAVDYWLKYDNYHSCRYHHNVIYCLTLG